MIIYAAAITIGVFSKPKWKQIKRNVSTMTAAADVDTDIAAADGEIAENDAAAASADGIAETDEQINGA